MKRLIAIICAVILSVSCIPHALALASADTNYKAVKVEGKYHASEILNAIEKQTRSANLLTTAEKSILNDVLLPTSMGITIPNIDPSKVIQTVDVYTLDSSFSEALTEHNVFRSHMTYSEYEEMESTWVLPDDFIEATKFSYPELQNVDMSSWTYGMYSEYIRQADEARFLTRFTAEEIQALNGRGILIDDLSVLLRNYYTIDNILAQSNETLKETIEIAYSFTYDKLQAEVNPTRYSPPAGQYTSVAFPGYNNGKTFYFHNDVMTTAYWRGIQSARALRMQQVMYQSSLSILCCTSLHGTFTESVGSAHEGIDFIYPRDTVNTDNPNNPPSGFNTRTPEVFAIFSGERLKHATEDHRLCVYDANHPNGARTHTYLHMNDIYPDDRDHISVGENVGQQGTKGADGYHVHFEVNPNRTTYLSLANTGNHDVESLSPYWVVNYLGCSSAHTYTWAHDSINHWRECTVSTCRYTTTPIGHTFSDGFCTICGRQDYNGITSK